ncbi:putative electron transfer flavoprotein subunit beta [Yarrowia sp. C11]|nr:putative electron transfer flavoprotein subunit beta [Yarrowia sp. E02]KAG5365264.1 putative electron transfer flavoprotein subunit beta [Yarrowia sp. C11]
MSNKLRIFVPVKRVIDFAVKPRVNKAGTGVETTGVKFSINPFCDIAVEEALLLKEGNEGLVENIHVASVGPSKAQDILRQALAKGADDSTLVEMGPKDAELEPLGVAKVLKKLIEEQKSNLVILGKQAIDGDNGQTGQILAGLLKWPQATQASKVSVNGDKVEVTREVDGGVETVAAKLPMIITTDLRLNEPRYVTLPNIMKAKKKPLKVVKIGEFDGVANRLETLKVAEPAKRQAGIKVETVDELVSKLKETGTL